MDEWERERRRRRVKEEVVVLKEEEEEEGVRVGRGERKKYGHTKNMRMGIGKRSEKSRECGRKREMMKDEKV